MTTPALAIGDTQNFSSAMTGLSWNLLEVVVDRACRVRFYSSLAALGADAGRAEGTYPAVGNELVFEGIFTGGLLDLTLSPMVFAGNTDVAPTAHLYAAITAKAAGVVNVTTTYLPAEA